MKVAPKSLLILISLLCGCKSDKGVVPKCCAFDRTLDPQTNQCGGAAQRQANLTLESLFADPDVARKFKLAHDPLLEGKERAACEKRRLLSNEGDSLSFILDGLGDDGEAVLFDVELEEMREEFCVDGSDLEAVALVCLERDEGECHEENGRICIRTCCPRGQVFHQSDKACVTDDEAKEETVEATFFSGPPEGCEVTREFDSRDEKFSLDRRGRLVLGERSYRQEEYCVTEVVGEEGRRHQEAHVCVREDLVEQETMVNMARTMSEILPKLFVVSLVFLLLTFALIFKRNRDKLFGLMTLSMITMLALFYAFFVAITFFGLSHPWLCQLGGFAVQFCYLSAVSWLNCMSYMIWQSFRSIRRANDNEPKGCLNPRLYRYALWAFGFPAVVTGVTLTVHFLPGDVTEGWILPEVGKHHCFLGAEAIFYYFHVFAGPCLILNLLGFLVTSWNLCFGVWSTPKHQTQSEKALKKQQQYRVCTLTKMFFAMGVTWLAEFASWLLGHAFGRRLWVMRASLAFDLINSLQGVVLFLVLFLDAPTVKKILGLCRRRRSSSSSSEARTTQFRASYRVRTEESSLVNDEEPNRVAAVVIVSASESGGERSGLRKAVSSLASPLRRTHMYNVNQ